MSVVTVAYLLILANVLIVATFVAFLLYILGVI